MNFEAQQDFNNPSHACDEVELMLRQSETQLHNCFRRLPQPARPVEGYKKIRCNFQYET